MAKEAQDHYRARMFRCHACAARDRLAKKLQREDKHDDAGLRFIVEPID